MMESIQTENSGNTDLFIVQIIAAVILVFLTRILFNSSSDS